jgi:hypothetical protein
MSVLGEYLAEVARLPWNHGDRPGPKRDCCTFPADWCIRAGYPDPMAFIRHAYASEEEAAAAIKAGGGLLKLASKGFASIGLKRTRQARDGDVAVIHRATMDALNVTCAIRSSDRWITLTDRGLLAHDGDKVLRAWRVEWAAR